MAATNKEKTRKTSKVKIDPNAGLILKKENYKILLLGLAVILVSYLLMAGGRPEDPAIYNPEVFSFRRITLAPLVALFGYGLIMYAIMKKPKQAEEDSTVQNQ